MFRNEIWVKWTDDKGRIVQKGCVNSHCGPISQTEIQWDHEGQGQSLC